MNKPENLRLLTHGILEDKQLNYMVITKFDADLELMFSNYKRKFPLQTVLTIGLQMLDLLEKFHSLGFIHNDMKPQNIMTKYGQNQVYLIDFGLTSNMADHKKYKFRGTPYFASNSALQKHGNGAKDDIEGLVYILIYFLYGNLPWSKDIPVLQDDVMSNLHIQNIIQMRNPYNLCQDIDSEFAQMLEYLQTLPSRKKPNYKLIRGYMEQMMSRYKYKPLLDWQKFQGPPVFENNLEARPSEQNMTSNNKNTRVNKEKGMKSQRQHQSEDLNDFEPALVNQRLLQSNRRHRQASQNASPNIQKSKFHNKKSSQKAESNDESSIDVDDKDFEEELKLHDDKGDLKLDKIQFKNYCIESKTLQDITPKNIFNNVKNKCLSGEQFNKDQQEELGRQSSRYWNVTSEEHGHCSQINQVYFTNFNKNQIIATKRKSSTLVQKYKVLK